MWRLCVRVFFFCFSSSTVLLHDNGSATMSYFDIDGYLTCLCSGYDSDTYSFLNHLFSHRYSALWVDVGIAGDRAVTFGN